MINPELITDIRSHINKLLINAIDNEENKILIDDLHQLFTDISGVSGNELDIQNSTAIRTAKGMALSLNHAALCLVDYKRTTLFLKGFVKAIKDKQNQFPNKKIEILYAGCGPYAPFFNLIVPLFSPEEISFTLMEINSNSLGLAIHIIESLQFTPYVKNCYTADAITCALPEPEAFDILFSETLDAVLYRESYVPIMANLLAQLPKNVTVIPHNVSLIVSNGSKVHSKTIFDTRESIKTIKDHTQLPEALPTFKISLSDFSSNIITIDTVVNVYDNLILKRGESSLSIPLEFHLKPNSNNTTVDFTYHLEPQIELKISYS